MLTFIVRQNNMANVGNRYHVLPARLLGFALAIATLSSGTADAQQARDAGNTPSITLSARSRYVIC